MGFELDEALLNKFNIVPNVGDFLAFNNLNPFNTSYAHKMLREKIIQYDSRFFYL